MPAAFVRRHFQTAAWPLVTLGVGLLPAGGAWADFDKVCAGVGAACAVAALILRLAARDDEELAGRIDKLADEVADWAANRQRENPGWSEPDWDRRMKDLERYDRETKTSWVRLAGRVATLVDEASMRGYDLSDSELGPELDFQTLTVFAGVDPTIRKGTALRVLAGRVRRGHGAKSAPAVQT